MSIGAALLFVAVMAWRFAPVHDRLQEVGFTAVIAWVVISLYRFRRRIWRRNPSRPDAMAATGLEYYCRQMEQRRDRLRDAWIWHGPPFLACTILVAILIGKAALDGALRVNRQSQGSASLGLSLPPARSCQN